MSTALPSMRVGILVVVLLVMACAPQSTAPGSQGQPSEERPRSTGPKTLTIALQREYDTAIEGEGVHLLRDGLVLSRAGVVEPLIATELISVEKGTWVINPDGTMDTTWKIKPNVKWHDGTPFTSEDLLFTYDARKSNATLAGGAASTLRTMVSASAPDPQTFVVRWNQVNVRAPEAVGLEPLPRHLLEASYNTMQPESFVAHPYFRTDFVGLGPYRLANWNLGIEMSLARFDEYHRGPSKIDRIILRFVPDPQVMVATILSGAVDVVLPPGVELEAASAVKQQWEGTGNQVAIGGGEPSISRFRMKTRSRDVKEQAVLAYAVSVGGRVTLVETAGRCQLGIEEAERILNDLAAREHAELLIADDGTLVYDFNVLTRKEKERAKDFV